MSKIWTALTEKGKFASIIGFLFALPVNVKTTIDYFKSIPYSEDQLIFLAAVNIICMMWFILPSSFVLRSGKLEIEIKD